MTTRILVADDQEIIRQGFRLILDAQPDMRVVADAADGVSALELARRLRPDVVLADIRMPRMDGLELTRALAGPGVDNPLRVVVVTTFDLDEYVHAALRNGACGFLLKRAGPTLLVEAIRAAMAGDALVSPSVTVRLLRHLRAPAGTQESPPTEALTDRELAVVWDGNRDTAGVGAALHDDVTSAPAHFDEDVLLEDPTDFASRQDAKSTHASLRSSL